jgi:hypothetical protein
LRNNTFFDFSVKHVWFKGGYDRRLKENVEYLEELKWLAQTEGVSDQVCFITSCSTAERNELLSNCLCVLYTPEVALFFICYALSFSPLIHLSFFKLRCLSTDFILSPYVIVFVSCYYLEFGQFLNCFGSTPKCHQSFFSCLNLKIFSIPLKWEMWHKTLKFYKYLICCRKQIYAPKRLRYPVIRSF